MANIVKSVLCLYMALSISSLATDIAKISVEEGISTAARRIPSMALDALTAPFKMLVKIVTSVVSATIKAAVKVLFAIMQLPIDVAWNTIPALGNIPKPDVKGLFS